MDVSKCFLVINVDQHGYVLMTSTSVASRSERLAEALSVGGGASIAAIFFLFFEAQKLPKNPLPLASPEVSKDGLWARGGKGLPVFGSTWVGLAACWRSFTIVMA